MLRKDNVFEILKNLVRFSPYVSEKVRLNTYALIDNKSQLEADNLSMAFSDFECGYFWARKFVYNGCKPNEIKTDYGALIVEHKVVKRPDVFSNTETLEIWLNVFDTPDCGGRLNKGRRREKVYDDNFRMMHALIAELKKYAEFDVTYADSSSGGVWATTGLIQQMLADGIITDYSMGIDLAGSVISIGDCFKNPRSFTSDSAYAVTCMIQIEVCADDVVMYSNYSLPDIAKKGIVAYNPITE